MKKYIFLFLIISSTVTAQTLTQDAEGQSTVLYQGGNVGIDITKANLTFAYTNLGLAPTSDTSNKFKFIWGVNASGKNNDGLTNIFERGYFQPEASLGGFVGVKYRFDTKPASLETLETQKEPLVKEKKEVNKAIDELKEKTDVVSIAKLTELKKKQKELDEKIQAINDQREKINNTRVRKLGIIYLRGERNATSFKLVEEVADAGSFSKKFNNKDFYGGTIGLGLNYETGKWLFGSSLDYEFTNNTELLTKQTYTLTTTETIGNQSLENKKEITAFSGNYNSYKRLNLNADVILFSSIDDEKRNYIAWNFYLRHKISQSKDVMPTYTNVGLGAYFFNKLNKFLGGVYVEAPDVFEKKEAQKLDPNFRAIHNRLSFGLVARFNFASILGPSY